MHQNPNADRNESWLYVPTYKPCLIERILDCHLFSLALCTAVLSIILAACAFVTLAFYQGETEHQAACQYRDALAALSAK